MACNSNAMSSASLSLAVLSLLLLGVDAFLVNNEKGSRTTLVSTQTPLTPICYGFLAVQQVACNSKSQQIHSILACQDVVYIQLVVQQVHNS